MPVGNSPGFVIYTFSGRTAVICGFAPDRLRLDDASRALWRRLAVHLGAGCRLPGRPDTAEAEDVEAVLHPDGALVHAEGQRASSRLVTSCGTPPGASIERGLARAAPTRCEPIAAADSIVTGTVGDFFCPGCGAAHPTWPAPGFLKQAKVEQVFLAPSEEAQAASPAPEREVRPIMFSCVNCGAGLRVATETPRVLSCGYCEVDNFLPAEVWNRLHPVRKRRAFWLRCR